LCPCWLSFRQSDCSVSLQRLKAGGYGLPGVSLNSALSARLPTHMASRGMMGSFAVSRVGNRRGICKQSGRLDWQTAILLNSRVHDIQRVNISFLQILLLRSRRGRFQTCPVRTTRNINFTHPITPGIPMSCSTPADEPACGCWSGLSFRQRRRRDPANAVSPCRRGDGDPEFWNSSPTLCFCTRPQANALCFSFCILHFSFCIPVFPRLL
jgi:hypothetical protein